MRQCAELTDELYVGITADADIQRFKGPNVFNAQERFELVSACKWAAKTFSDVPWLTNTDYLDAIDCPILVHGDDPCMMPDGSDAYQMLKDANRFVTVKRTKSVSTTDLIGRMLRLPQCILPESIDQQELEKVAGSDAALQRYIPGAAKIAQFANTKEPRREDRIVYCDGVFDLLHPGHVSFLRKAKELGDYLIVGVHEDHKDEYGAYPIMNLHERVLNLLALRYVDDVIIGAPRVISQTFFDQIGPSVVVMGHDSGEEDRHRVPKQLGVFRQIESDYPELATKQVVRRVLENYSIYFHRNQKRSGQPVPV
jgi:ethanolamine-phosphate cytidylyltransferase